MSYYEQQLQGGFPPARPTIPATRPQDEPFVCDVCVVGGGLAGLSTAVSLAEHGKSVVVLEAEQVGWGASGRNAGFVMAGFALEVGDLRAEVGDEAARQLFALSVMGQRVLRRRIEEHGIDCGLKDCGSLEMSFEAGTRAETAATAEVGELNSLLGTVLEVWPAAKARLSCKSPLYHYGVYDPSTFAVDPLRLTLGLASVAERLGVVIFENSRATSLLQRETQDIQEISSTGSLPEQQQPLQHQQQGQQQGQPQVPQQSPHARRQRRPYYEVTVDGGGGNVNGVVACDHVVLCGAAQLDRGLSRRIAAATVPIYTYIMVTKPLPPGTLAGSVTGPYAVVDMKNVLNYYRPLGGGRLLFGSLVSAKPLAPKDIAPALTAELRSLYPQLHDREIPIEAAWGGELAATRRLMPLVGRERSGVWFATGFGGHGLNTTVMAGELIAGAIASDGQDTRYRQLQDLYAPGWEGGPLKTVAAGLMIKLFELQDWWRVRCWNS